MTQSKVFCEYVLRFGILAGGLEFALAFPPQRRLLGAILALVWVGPSLWYFGLAFAEFGSFILLEMLWIVLVYSDSAQLLVGKLFGKHKGLIRVSPNKTLEGYLGGVLVAAVLGHVLHQWPWAPLFVVLLGGIAGDLTFSAAKRLAGIKDFSRLLGAHGGICDRIDSYIGAAHALYWSSLVWDVEVRQALVSARGAGSS